MSSESEINKQEWAKEEQWLEYVLQVLRKSLDESEQVAGTYKGRLREERKSLWQQGLHQVNDFDDVVELQNAEMGAREHQKQAVFYRLQALRYKRMEDSPYFGRVDFKEKGYDTEKIYVGIGSLHEPVSGDILVYDWRAPVCSLFYDAEVGPARYTWKEGSVGGEVLLKRQYKVEDGVLQFMFDTSLKIDDEMLQELLGRNVDEKMRTIVTSIQREQNRIIRDEGHELVVVQGPAGSGKTAIALHRAAYLLYRHRDTLSADNIVIFSPNQIFSDYISAVLPALGEENVLQTTFQEFTQKNVGKHVQVEDMPQQLEYLLGSGKHKRHHTRVAAIRYKSSAEFTQVLRNTVDLLNSGNATNLKGFFHKDQEIISAEEMKRLFHENYRDLPFVRRLKKIRDRILYLLAPLEEQVQKEWQKKLAQNPDMFEWEVKRESRRRTEEEFRSTKDKLNSWSQVNLMALYRRLFTDRKLFRRVAEGTEVPQEWSAICHTTIEQLQQNRLSYEDAAPFLYLSRGITGEPAVSTVRHVIIDEAQDYSPLQYELIGLTFPRSSFTVLGDLNQSVHPLMGLTDYQQVVENLNKQRAEVVKLTRSYRSTEEIMDFAKAILKGSENVPAIERHGAKPLLIECENSEALAEALRKDIKAMQGRGRETIAILCKTAAESGVIYQMLKGYPGLGLVRKDDRQFRSGVLVLPVYLAKGLEFDGVIIATATSENFSAKEDRQQLYVACTRALHELRLYHQGEPSPFVTEIDHCFYETESQKLHRVER